MHPFLRDRKQLLVYLLLWLAPEAYFAYGMWNSTPPWPLREAIGVAVLHCLLLSGIFLSLYAICRTVPLKQTEVVTFLVKHACVIIVASGFWLGVGWTMVWMLDRIHGTEFRTMHYQNMLPHLMFFSGAILSLAQAVNYLLLSLEDQRETERSREQMRTLAREAELRSLRAQINPHFLFNSLNSVSALTTINPERAREMCLLIAEFFRRNLDIGNQETTTLGQEVDLVFHYLQIEMARFGKRLQVDLDVPDSLRNFEVPPLILQPLVENAVKHGIAGMVEGGVVMLRARPLSSGGVSILIENPFDPDQPKRRRKGIGLDNVRSRLHARYGENARFEAIRDGGHFRAKIQIAEPMRRRDAQEEIIVEGAG